MKALVVAEGLLSAPAIQYCTVSRRYDT